VDVIFLIDQTTSISEADYEVQLQFVLNLAYRLLEYNDAKVAAYSYSNRPSLIASLSEDLDSESFAQKVLSHPYFPSMPTYLFYAIEDGRNHFQNE
jgi:hypothetical protein